MHQLCQRSPCARIFQACGICLPLNAKEEQLLKEIDDDMLWFDLTYLLNEPQEREAPEIHITIDYTVRAFEETEKEYLELYSFFTH